MGVGGSKPVPAGMSLPVSTLSFRPTKSSPLERTAALVSTVEVFLNLIVKLSLDYIDAISGF